jgi:glutaredoxin
MSKITVFSSPSCPYCVQLKTYLDDNKVKYEEINLAQQPEKGEELVKKTGQMGVPVTIIEEDGEEQAIIGFDVGKLNQALGLDK